MKKAFLFIFALCLLFAACTKTSNTQITGTYIGDEGLANPPIIGGNDSVTISQGSAANSIAISDAHEGVKLNATISHDSITIPNQIISPGQSVIDTFYGSGLVRGDSLFLNVYENSNVSPYNFAIDFEGGKR